MSENFDKIIDRRDSDSIKYRFWDRFGKSPENFPMWVADMDFATPAAVTNALKRLSEEETLGYTFTPDTFFDAVCGWFAYRFSWTIRPDWIVETPGVMFAVATAIRVLTEPGDAVLLNEPVYRPLSDAITGNGRRKIVSQLRYADSVYGIDFDELESQIVREKVRLILLCSPHNPVGRVWTRSELSQLGEIALRHRIPIISDEIHADLIASVAVHTPLASLNDELAQNVILCASPTKTFNFPALGAANIIIPNANYRELFRGECLKLFYYGLNRPAMAAASAAYRNGRKWHRALLAYLAENIRFAHNFFRENGGLIEVTPTEGTYLLWLDCRKLALSDAELDRFFTEDANLWLHRGIDFGQGGEGFMRMNVALPRPQLETVLSRLKDALQKRWG